MPSRRKLAPKAIRDLVEMAIEEGYEPGQYSIRRIQEITCRLEAWRMHVRKYGTPPEGYERVPIEEFMDLYAKEAAEAMRMEMGILDYFHPKKRSTDATVAVEGEVTLLELLTGGSGST